MSDLGWENVNWEVFLEGTPEGKIQNSLSRLWNEVVKKARRDRPGRSRQQEEWPRSAKHLTKKGSWS